MLHATPSVCTHIKENLDAGQQEHQLLLDDCDGVLTGSPNVAVEEVPREAERQRELGRLVGRDETKCWDLGDLAGGDDGSNQKEDNDAEDEAYHDRDDAIQLAKAQHDEGKIETGPLGNAVEDEDPVSGEEDEQREQARRLCERGGTKMWVWGEGQVLDTECG